MNEHRTEQVTATNLLADAPRDNRLRVRDQTILTGVLRTAIPLLLVTTGYAVIRYNIVGATPWHQVPLFVFNKAVAWSGLTLICLALSMGALARLAPHRFAAKLWLRKYIGLCGFVLASLHVVMSFFIISPGYFPRFYMVESGRMTGLAELTMLLGAVSWILLLTLAFASLPTVINNMSRGHWIRWQQVAGLWAAVLGGVHVFYGYESWLQPQGWSGGLPPITLLSAMTVAAMLVVRRLASRKRTS